MVRKLPLLRGFLTRNDHFAKTGSGRTWENIVEKEGVYFRRGNQTCDPHRQEPSTACGGLYVNSVLPPGAHTDNEWWAYMDAPVNLNDEAPLVLFAAEKVSACTGFGLSLRT